MATLASDGSVTLAAGEAQQLRKLVHRWELASRTPGADTGTPLVDLGCAVRDLLDGVPATWAAQQ